MASKRSTAAALGALRERPRTSTISACVMDCDLSLGSDCNAGPTGQGDRPAPAAALYYHRLAPVGKLRQAAEGRADTKADGPLVYDGVSAFRLRPVKGLVGEAEELIEMHAGRAA